MAATIDIDDVTVQVVRKAIKHIYLRVDRSSGQARISAPHHVSLSRLRTLAFAKLDWIKQQQSRPVAALGRHWLEGRAHLLWGRRYPLEIVHQVGLPTVAFDGKRLLLRIGQRADQQQRQAVLAQWYRLQVRQSAGALVEHWQPVMGVEVKRLSVRWMKTRWGSCTPLHGSIRLNTELASKPKNCLEYVVVHEMVHLLEASHNARFRALMDGFLPGWRTLRAELNHCA